MRQKSRISLILAVLNQRNSTFSSLACLCCSLTFTCVSYQQIKKEYGSNVVPAFPPKKIFTLTPAEVEQRREQLEKYMQSGMFFMWNRPFSVDTFAFWPQLCLNFIPSYAMWLFLSGFEFSSLTVYVDFKCGAATISVVSCQATSKTFFPPKNNFILQKACLKCIGLN